MISLPKKRQNKAQSLVELAFGASIIVLACPFLIDLLVLVITADINNDIVAKAARVAANQTNVSSISAAVASVQTQSLPANNPIIKGLQLTASSPDSNNLITVTSKMTINLPFGIPGFGQSNLVLTAAASDPAANINPGSIP